MIKAHGLTRKFGRFLAVDSIDFEIPAGQVVGFLGPNGAGKTTTIRMICGYLRPTAGRVLIDGIDVATAPQRGQRRIGYLPESTPLYTEMRVDEYLAFRGRLFGLKRAERRGIREKVGWKPLGHWPSPTKLRQKPLGPWPSSTKLRQKLLGHRPSATELR